MSGVLDPVTSGSHVILNLIQDLVARIQNQESRIKNLPMPTLIPSPTVIESAGNMPKRIEEYAGRINTGQTAMSVARMKSPAGWQEPGQTPDFEEITVVLKGLLRVEHATGVLDVAAGQAVLCSAGEWVRYSSPELGGAEYVAVCLPAFSPETVHRDDE